MPSYKSNTSEILTKLKAFSMVEVLLSILIISIIIALSVPVISKRDHDTTIRQVGGSEQFLFSVTGEENEFPCYVTKFNDNDPDDVEIVDDGTGNCAEYRFTVPRGVNMLNLTLVAGGGGGGGAAGGTLDKRQILSYDEPIIEDIPQGRIKGITIDLMTGAGADGSKIDNTLAGAVKGGTGGDSGSAIMNYDIPLDLIRIGYTPNFISESSIFKYDTDWHTSLMQLGFVDSLDALYSAPYLAETGEVHFNGPGFVIRRNTYGTDESEQFHVYVSDSKGQTYSYSNASCMRLSQTAGGVVNFSATADILKQENTADVCGLNKGNFYPAVEGSEGISVNSSSFMGEMHTGYKADGGAGGKIASLSGSMGAGGKGQSVVLKCQNNQNSCYFNFSNNLANTSQNYLLNDAEVIETSFASRNRYGRATLTLEHPGGTGSGGAGGTAVKINNFPVTPGATYTIVVGAGGAGGNKGATGEVRRNANNTTSEIIPPKAGSNGESGSCSAIYDEDGNLVLMVAGGVGGFGGTINEAAYNPANEFPMPSAPVAARYEATLLSDNINLDNLIYDDLIVASVQDDLNYTTADGIPNARRVVYSFVQDEQYPLYELNTNSIGVGLSQSFDMIGGYDDRMGGFSNYNNSIAATFNDLFFKPEVTYKGDPDNIRNTLGAVAGNVYNGFHFRYGATREDNTGGLMYAPNRDLMYAGGLGGVSGLGTKAGCGGFFLGNIEGLTDDRNNTTGGYLYADDYAGTFSIKTKNGDDRTFKTEDYYDGCSAYTPDGHSAKFVAPLYSKNLTQTLGQAGAGGGGGGWSMDMGPGAGGAGQDGYVLIDWLK